MLEVTKVIVSNHPNTLDVGMGQKANGFFGVVGQMLDKRHAILSRKTMFQMGSQNDCQECFKISLNFPKPFLGAVLEYVEMVLFGKIVMIFGQKTRKWTPQNKALGK